MEGPDTEKAERGGPSGFCALSGFPGSGATFPTDGFTGRSAARPGRAGRWPAMPTKVGIYQSRATHVNAGGRWWAILLPASGRHYRKPRYGAVCFFWRRGQPRRQP